MGIVGKYEQLEEYLFRELFEWKALSDKEYIKLVKAWRGAFEKKLMSCDTILGEKGIQKLENELPFNGFLFNSPNYRYLTNRKIEQKNRGQP